MKAWRFAIVGILAIAPSMASASILRSMHERPHGGFVGRFNVAQMEWRTGPDIDTRPIAAFSLGGFVILPASRSWAFQLEGVYTQKGGETQRREGSRTKVTTTRLDYVELATLAQFSLPLASDLRVFGEFGPVFGIALDEEYAEFETAYRTKATEGPHHVNPFELGAAVGAGIAIPMDGVGLLFGVRHHWGLTSISAHPEIAVSRNFQIQTGLYF